MQDLLVPSLMNKGTDFCASSLSMVPGIPIKPMLAKYIYILFYLSNFLLSEILFYLDDPGVLFNFFSLSFFLHLLLYLVGSQMAFPRFWSHLKIRHLPVNISMFYTSIPHIEVILFSVRPPCLQIFNVSSTQLKMGMEVVFGCGYNWW